MNKEINHFYRGYIIKVYEQEPDKEWVKWQLLEDQEEADFPCNAYGEYGYEICDMLGQVLDSDFKTMGDVGACLHNAEWDIDLIVKGEF